MVKGFRIISILTILFMFLSCSTTRVLQDDQYRLAGNKIKVENDKEFNPNQLNKYLKQNKGLGWSPFLYVYNWTNGNGGNWDRFVQRIGKAPVVYDPELVDQSVTNIKDHLEYIGYYASEVESEIKVNKRTVKVVYNVSLGKRYPIKDITLQLPSQGEFRNAFLEDSTVFSVKPGDYLSEISLETETEVLAAIMRNKGFYDFSKNNFFFEADTISDPGSALLTMQVNEYTRNESPKEAKPIRRYYIDNVTFSYPKTLNIKENVLRNLNTVIPGEVYSENMINQTYARLSALRVFSSVNIGMTPKDTNLIDCSISLAQSKLQGVKLNLEASTNSSGLFGISPHQSL